MYWLRGGYGIPVARTVALYPPRLWGEDSPSKGHQQYPKWLDSQENSKSVLCPCSSTSKVLPIKDIASFGNQKQLVNAGWGGETHLNTFPAWWKQGNCHHILANSAEEEHSGSSFSSPSPLQFLQKMLSGRTSVTKQTALFPEWFLYWAQPLISTYGD